MTTRVVNNHLVIETDNPARLRAVLPSVKDAIVQGVQYCAVPFTLDAARVLRNLGYDAPSPIRTQYDWPGNFTPRWYQVDTSEFFTFHHRCHCHNAPRVGKTLSALWASDYLRRGGQVRRVLIVSPLSTLWDVWEQNIFEHFPLRTFAVLHGPREKRLKLLAKEHDYYIINHHGVQIIEEALRTRPDIDLVIVDEVAEFFSPVTSTMWKPLNRVLNQHGIPRMAWGMTGTPNPEGRPTDAYGQCKLITPENYKGTATNFKRDTMLQVGTFKWVPRRGSEETVKRVLQPSIRFERTVCTDLEPCLIERRAELSAEQQKHYKALLHKAATEIDGNAVTAVNAAVLISKIVQVACLSADTMVLSSRGWVPIQQITGADLVWDGEEWVHQGGCVYKGRQQMIKCGGVWMTPDHRVLTTSGWKNAEDVFNGDAGEGSDWPEVRLPSSGVPSRVYRGGGEDTREANSEEGGVVVPVRLWAGSNPSESVPETEVSQVSSQLRMPHRGPQQNPRDDAHETIQHLGEDAAQVPEGRVEGLGELRRPWSYCVRPLGVVRELLGRYAAWVRGTLNAWAERQRRSVLPRELSLGNRDRAGQQQADERHVGHPGGADDCCTGRGAVWGQQIDAVSAGSQGVPSGTGVVRAVKMRSAAPVFDLLNCGSRSRFVVRGESGELRIVHNCGVVLDAHGELNVVDFGPRLAVLEELISQNEEKVIVFVPFTGVLEELAKRLRKHWSVAVVEGDVTPAARTRIFREFRALKDPHVIVAHPQCMAHGLDLTAASLAIWYAPVYANKIYEQACARIDGSRQTAKIDIAHIYATPEERGIFQALREKKRLQDVVLALLKNNL